MAAPGPPHGISSHDATKFRRPKSNFVAQPRNGVRILRGDFSTKSARTVQPAGPAVTMPLSDVPTAAIRIYTRILSVGPGNSPVFEGHWRRWGGARKIFS